MEKIRELFAGMIVKKDNKNDQFSILGIPSFIRDWFIRRYANENGEINTDFVASKIKEILPRKENQADNFIRLIFVEARMAV